MIDEKLLKLADEYIEATYESELPPDCCVAPDITVALCKYLRRIFVEAYARGQREGYDRGYFQGREDVIMGAKTAWVDSTALNNLRYPDPFYEMVAAHAERPDDSPAWIPVKLLKMELDKEAESED